MPKNVHVKGFQRSGGEAVEIGVNIQEKIKVV